MIKYNDEKVTPTQAAKLHLGDRVSFGEDFWSEDDLFDHDALTDGEIARITAAMQKQADRIYRLIGYWETREKVYGA